MKTSPTGLALIEKSEGFRAMPYQDVAGKWTVGFGHLILPGEDFSAGITLEQAQYILSQDVSAAEDAVNAHMDPSCNQNQFDSLCDFAYNLGVGALQTMLSHGWDEVPMQIVRWDHVNGIVSPGLMARRQAEATLFTKEE